MRKFDLIKNGIVYGFIFILLGTSTTLAQTKLKNVKSQNQYWIGYMTSTKLSDKIAIWNDFHFVPNGFYGLRTGLTYHLASNTNITAGYAFLGLPDGSQTNGLNRQEHRPWGQMIITNPIAKNWSNTLRIRYDARFKQDIIDSQLSESYTFNNRLRFLVSFRKQFPNLKFGDDWQPFINLSDELHFNFGKAIVYNYMDQNRVTFTLGAKHNNFSAQIGYMNRFVQLPSGNNFVMNHTAVLWLAHNFQMHKINSAHP
jgi:hypothetical protein